MERKKEKRVTGRTQESLESPIDSRSDRYRGLACESADGSPGARTRAAPPMRPTAAARRC